jgi:hypothetical protein
MAVEVRYLFSGLRIHQAASAIHVSNKRRSRVVSERYAGDEGIACQTKEFVTSGHIP